MPYLIHSQRFSQSGYINIIAVDKIDLTQETKSIETLS